MDNGHLPLQFPTDDRVEFKITVQRPIAIALELMLNALAKLEHEGKIPAHLHVVHTCLVVCADDDQMPRAVGTFAGEYCPTHMARVLGVASGTISSQGRSLLDATEQQHGPDVRAAVMGMLLEAAAKSAILMQHGDVKDAEWTQELMDQSRIKATPPEGGNQ